MAALKQLDGKVRSRRIRDAVQSGKSLCLLINFGQSRVEILRITA
jgi:hypothetical protein